MDGWKWKFPLTMKVKLHLLVTSENLEYPIVGKNAIEHLYRHPTKHMSCDMYYLDVYQTIYQNYLIP